MNQSYQLHDQTVRRIVDEFRDSDNPTKRALAGTLLAQNSRLRDEYSND